MAPLRGSEWCWTHNPENARERAEARKRGGSRRRTPGTLLDGAESQADLQKALADMLAVRSGIDLVWRETLRQENSGSRSRTLVAVLMAAMKALEVGEYEARMQAPRCTLPRATGTHPGRATTRGRCSTAPRSWLASPRSRVATSIPIGVPGRRPESISRWWMWRALEDGSRPRRC
jgi:hypothetical protein